LLSRTVFKDGVPATPDDTQPQQLAA